MGRSKFWGGFQKNKHFLGGRGYEYFVDIFRRHHKIELYLGVISMHFRVFSGGQGTEWGIFFYYIFFFFFWGGGGGVSNFNIFGVFEIPEFFGGLRVNAWPEPTYEEKLRVPPPWGS